MRTEPLAGNTAATEWDRTAAQRALDELFQFALQYDSCKEFQDLMRFIARFRLYSPFNAMESSPFLESPSGMGETPRL